MSEAGEKTYVVVEGVLPGVARGAVANKGGTVVTAVMPKSTNTPRAAAQHKSAAAVGFSFRLQEPAEKKEESSSAWAVLGEWPTWDCNR
ncbi:hypothetical protein E2562_017138 [Oryza meyeriana var. granulata]|uniref:Uncharacterized protein n=1 Tax=Oryza meyeriana var. granulata TaxID=110450 RepID=A0A6G1DXL6_9ORYZ|nr:hypothetical protein E2562_017138 [Oryza meyeriana var. granulata]